MNYDTVQPDAASDYTREGQPVGRANTGKANAADLVEYAERLSRGHAKVNGTASRKARGQFFTPKAVGAFMSRLFKMDNAKIRLLDPGAGTGILTAAFCERVMATNKAFDVTVDAYENDPEVMPLLEKTLEACRAKLEAEGHKFHYNIVREDFIVSNQRYLGQPDLFSAGDLVSYDFIVSNPPYFKLNKGRKTQSCEMLEMISGQPNMYAWFMAVSLSMLKQGGEMVFITPRSFCSGLYYRRFREWLLRGGHIAHIHVFESRKDVFERDEVLQESIIIKVVRDASPGEYPICITASENNSFDRFVTVSAESSDIIDKRAGQSFVRIPTSSSDLDILHTVDRWPCSLSGLGLEISTGPVVPFRAEGQLLSGLLDAGEWVPLLWAHNLKPYDVTWPRIKNGKPVAIRVNADTNPILVPVKNYVLLKRFTSKEEKRRLQTSVLLRSQFPYPSVGIENHVNYIHRPAGELTPSEAVGVAAILNMPIVDRYFRMVNGHTQVNATDIRSLPLPSIERIRAVGETVSALRSHRSGHDLEHATDRIVSAGVPTS